MLEKYKNDELSLENGKALCSKVSETYFFSLINSLEFIKFSLETLIFAYKSRNNRLKEKYKKQAMKYVPFILKLAALYELIGAKSIRKSSDLKA